MAITKWQALDADGNVIDSWTGPQKASRIGTDWKGTRVVSIVEVVKPDAQQAENKRLEQLIVALTDRVTALENA